MGVRTELRDKNTAKAGQKRMVRMGVDGPLLITVFTLLVIGALMVYSASWDFSLYIYEDPSFIFNRQLMWIGLGILAAFICSYIDYHYWQKFAVPVMVVTILSLVAVLLVQDIRLNAARSLSGGSYQPSEAAKLMTVIYLSVWLYSKRDFLNQVSFGLFPLAGILGLVGGLIFLQPDVSAVLTVVVIGGLMFFLAGGDMKQIVLVIILTIVVGWIVVQTSETGRARLESYWDGVMDPLEASYHVQRSWEAFVNGGWFGVGIGNADTKHTGLPVPPTDSIYAVIGEETGVFGATLMVGLFSVLLWRGLEIARRAPDLLGALLAGGLTIWISMEAFVNMAVIVGLMPFAGNALPFISAGGSSMLVTMVSIGILLNVSRISERIEMDSVRKTGEVVDFQRRRVFSPFSAPKPARGTKPVGQVDRPSIREPMAQHRSSRKMAVRRLRELFNRD